MTRRLFMFALIVVLAATPVLAQESGNTDVDATVSGTVNFSDTFAFQRNGIFGCSLNGSFSMSVGALSAVGGVFVPVNDAAVTLNTGYLVYKECVLRGIVNRMRENETASLLQAILLAYQRGRDGLPLFSQNLKIEKRDTFDEKVVSAVKNNYLDTLDPTFQTAVKRSVVQRYAAARNKPNQAFSCPATSNFWDRIGALAKNPACSAYWAGVLVESDIYSSATADWNDILKQLEWGRGNYPRTVKDASGNDIVVTPSSLVDANITQAVQTGFRQLENANDIDQMVGALFAGITTHVLSDQGGLSGVLQRTGSQQSYLDRVVRESAAGLRGSAANAALQILGAAKQIEEGFLATMSSIAQLLTQSIADLRAKENACWSLIIENVCATAPGADGTCTAKTAACTQDDQGDGANACPTGATLKIATSTARSQAVIDARIAPLATSTAANIRQSEEALGLIAKLIADVTNTASLTTQRLALQQLDTLVSQRALHNQYDLQNAQQTKDSIAASMDTLQTDTAQAWGDSQDPAVGWCNVNNQAVLDLWKEVWRQ